VRDRSLSSPVLEHDRPQTPTYVGVQRAERELLAGRPLESIAIVPAAGDPVIVLAEE